MYEWERLQGNWRAKLSWLEQRQITKSQISKWCRQKDKWEKWTKRNLKKCNYRLNEIGKPRRFGHQEEKLLNLFTVRRAQGLRVTHKWLMARFAMILKIDKPEGWETWKPNTGWTYRFCKRHKITLQKRTNRKSKTIYERLHLIQKYHRKLIYDFQNLENFGNPENQAFFGTPESKMWFYRGNYVRTRAQKHEDDDHPSNDGSDISEKSRSLDSECDIPEE